MKNKKKSEKKHINAKPKRNKNHDQHSHKTSSTKQNMKENNSNGNIKKNEANSISQQQQQQRSVYKRIPIFPKVLSSPINTNYFVTESNPRFQEVINGPYEGFKVEFPGQYPNSMSESYQTALVALDTDEFYQFDMTQPAGLGTKVARTFVSRCLVGDAGMTYKYLGLRMFAHPWNRGEVGANSATIAIGQLNEDVRQRAHSLNLQSGKPEIGSSHFNLTLINRCFPSKVSAKTFPLKKEPYFGRDLCSVSWHADSSLDHYSSIAVYHFEQMQQQENDNEGWRVALRVQVNAEGPQQGRPAPGVISDNNQPFQPPVCLRLPQECLYYMLDDFNHHHQHAVLAGHTHRYASTHRVSRVEGHSYGYINQRVTHFLGEKLRADRMSIRRTILLAEEVEFEWLRQYYIQGSRHHLLHPWWHVPMQNLLEQLSNIELRIVKQFSALLVRKTGISFKSETTPATKQQKKLEQLALTVSDDCYAEMAALLHERWEKRRLWLEREKDPIYLNMPEDIKPMSLVLDTIDSHWTQIDSVICNLTLESFKHDAVALIQ